MDTATITEKKEPVAFQDRKVLQLNKTWHPMHTIPLEKALHMVFNDRARIINPEEFTKLTWEDWTQLKPLGDDGIRAANMVLRVPEIIILNDYDKIPQPKKTFSRRHIYQHYHYTCFTPDTLILMSDGSLKTIDAIGVGDRVLDAYGKPQVVEYVHTRQCDESIVAIRRRGNGDTLRSTADHRMLVVGRDGEFMEVRADALGLKDKLAEPYWFDLEGFVEEIDLASLWKSKNVRVDRDRIRSHYHSKPIPRKIRFDSSFGRLIGYFLAEGCVVGNSVTFTFHQQEAEYAADVQRLLKSIMGLRSSNKEYPENNKRVVLCCSSGLAKVLRGLLYSTGDKRLESKSYPREFLEGVLYGVVRGDSNFDEELSRCTVTMKRENLIRDIYLISLILGLRPTLSKTGVRTDGRIYKSVIYNGEEYNKIVGICKVTKNQYTRNTKTDRRVMDGKLISKINSLSVIPYSGKVYDLQVGGSHTYVANFACVHNCQYCGSQPGSEELNIDHVIPKAQGGQTTWENCVLACIKCNSKKRDRTPEQAGMKLRCVPSIPGWKTFKRETYRVDSWSQFLGEMYWCVTLEK